MAYVKIKQHTGNTGTLINYILDIKKTNYNEYVYGYNCEPEFADLEFEITNYYRTSKRGDGVGVGVGNKNISAYHIIQSFDYSDDITPEEALQIGIKFANEMFGNEYEYVVATHVDKKHIHNHIAVNATSFLTYKKYQCKPYKTIAKMRRISDHLCEEYGFSVIEHPVFKKGKEKGFYAEKEGRSSKATLTEIIDEAILHSSSWEEFKIRLSEEKVLIKEGKNSDYIAFKLPEDKRYTGGKTLGDGYTKDNILSRISTGKVKEDPILKISWHKKMLEKETELSYISRIPYTQTYVEFKKSEVRNKGQIYYVTIKPNKIYHIKDKVGNEVGTLKGTEFFNHYQDISNYKGRLQKEEIKKVIESEDEAAVETYATQFLWQTKKAKKAEIDEISKALLYIRREGITSFDEFEAKLDAHETKLLEYESEVKKYEKQIALYNRALAYLESKTKIKEVYKEYALLGGRKKEAFKAAHIKEISEYELSEKKLHDMGVDDNIDAQKIQASLEKASEIVNDLKNEIKAENRRLKAVSDAKLITYRYSKEKAVRSENMASKETNER